MEMFFILLSVYLWVVGALALFGVTLIACHNNPEAAKTMRKRIAFWPVMYPVIVCKVIADRLKRP
jgi:hypothetical protein